MTFLLEVAIGLVLVYTVLSMFCTAINEWIARFSNLRATTLKVGINELLADKSATSLAKEFHEHPLITGLCYKKRYAQYIPSKTFALAILDTAFKETSPGKYDVDAAKYPAAAAATPPAIAKTPGDLLNAVVRGAGGNPEQIVARLSTWFDDSMDRVSGVYKRKTQVFIFLIALGLAIAFHVDTIGLARRIQRDSVLRTALNAQATAMVKQPRDSADWKAQMDKLEAAHLPLGWSCAPFTNGCSFDPVAPIGIFMTAIALALGAPFWFDTLNKLVNLRQTGVPPDEKDAKTPKKP